MLGRAFHYAVGALAEKGPPHLIHILTDDMRLAMGNIGARRLSDLAGEARALGGVRGDAAGQENGAHRGRVAAEEGRELRDVLGRPVREDVVEEVPLGLAKCLEGGDGGFGQPERGLAAVFLHRFAHEVARGDEVGGDAACARGIDGHFLGEKSDGGGFRGAADPAFDADDGGERVELRGFEALAAGRRSGGPSSRPSRPCAPSGTSAHRGRGAPARPLPRGLRRAGVRGCLRGSAAGLRRWAVGWRGSVGRGVRSWACICAGVADVKNMLIGIYLSLTGMWRGASSGRLHHPRSVPMANTSESATPANPDPTAPAQAATGSMPDGGGVGRAAAPPCRARPDHRGHRAADDRGRSRRDRAPVLGGHRLHPRLDRLGPALWQARRSLRAADDGVRVGRAVPARLGAGGLLALDGRADRLARRAGAWRRRAVRAGARGHRRRHPAARSRQGAGRLRGGVLAVERARAADRRLVRRGGELALDLLHQHPARASRGRGLRRELCRADRAGAPPDRLGGGHRRCRWRWRR